MIAQTRPESTVQRLVLDTSYFERASQGMLVALRARGFVLSIGSHGIAETWARAQRERRPGLLLGALNRLAPHLDTGLPVIMGANWLRDEIDAPSLVARRELERQHMNRGRQMLGRALASVSFDQELGRAVGVGEFDDEGRRLNERLNGRGDGYLGTLDTWRNGAVPMFDPAEPEASLIDGFERWLVTTLNSSTPERFDAYVQTQARAAAAAAKRTEARTPEENDSEDAGALALVAAPAFVTTFDLGLIERVDASWTYQRPWVRTIGELLTDELPEGPPWGESAQLAAERFGRRDRQALVALDESVRAAHAGAPVAGATGRLGPAR